MKKMICLFLLITVSFVSCGVSSNSAVVPQSNSVTNESLSQIVSSDVESIPEKTGTGAEIEHIAVRISPDNTFSICRGESPEYNAYMNNYYILDNVTEETVNLGDYFYPEIKFLSQDEFSFADSDYYIFSTKGEVLLRLSDYFPIGETADGRDNVISSVLRKDDGGLLVVYFDRNEIVSPEEGFNNGTLNEPHIYKVAVISPEGKVEKNINTGKNVESSKHFYVALELELKNNTLICYMPLKNCAEFEMQINLTTDQCEIIDYRQ